MTKPQPRLGRGLSSLISVDLSVPPKAQDQIQNQESVPTGPRLVMVQIAKVRTNPAQPRRNFDENALTKLSASLKSRGILQPIVVRPVEGGFELIAGERRMRAAVQAGLAELPAIVRHTKDEELLELALIENLHREDLNPIERAKAYQTLCARYKLTQDQIAERTGDDRATVANYLRILTLPETVIDLVANGELTTGHAKAILSITDNKLQIRTAEAIVKGRWSVRQAEAAAAKTRPRAPEEANDQRPAVKDLETTLSAKLGTRVRIHEGRRKHTGRVVIEYYNLDDFERLTALLGVSPESA